MRQTRIARGFHEETRDGVPHTSRAKRRKFPPRIYGRQAWRREKRASREGVHGVCMGSDRMITAIMGERLKLMVRTFAAFGFIVCLQAMTWACSSRISPAGMPVPRPPDRPPEAPSTVASTPEPPAPAPPQAVVPEPGSVDCALIAEPGEPIATVALSDRIDPSHAPHPANESER